MGSGVVSSVAGGVRFSFSYKKTINLQSIYSGNFKQGTVGPNGIINPPNHVFSPEYDDPANIEDEYGYNSPNRRGSLGRRSMGIER